MSFADDIKAFEKKVLEEIDKSVCNVYQKFTTSVISLSPTSAVGKYSKNLLVNQWYSDIGVPSINYTLTTSPNGSDSLARVKTTIAQKPFFGKDNVLYFTNNLPYAYRAEVLGWPEGQMGTYGVWKGALPYGMVNKSLIMLRGQYL